MLPTIKAVIPNKPPDRNGELPIMIRITFKRKLYHKAIGLKTSPSFFSSEKLIALSVPNAAYKNKIIKEKIRDIELEFLKRSESGEIGKEFIEAVIKNKDTSNSFYEIAKKIIEKQRGTFSPRTIKTTLSQVKKFNDYSPGISISNIDNNIIKDYQYYLRNKLKNKNNTVGKSVAQVKAMLTKMHEEGLTDKNLSNEIKKPKYIQSQRAFLNEEDVLKLEDYVENGASNFLRNIAAWFLLQCYSGVRYGDMVNWNESKMVKNGKLLVTDEKTKTPHYVPIYPKLKKAIERVRGIEKIPTNQVCNRYLKEIAKMKEINTPITTHTARHTFAVNYLNNGGSIEVLSKLLGHASIKTTAIYGQITNKRIDEETFMVFNKK